MNVSLPCRQWLLSGLMPVVCLAAGAGTDRLTRDGHRVSVSVLAGKLTEVYQVRTPDGWRDALAYDGPQMRLARPIDGKVLFDFEQDSERQVTLEGLPPHVLTHSKRTRFRPHGEWFVGTCEDGRGGYNDDYTGQLELGPVTLPHRYVSLLVSGGRKPDQAYVAVLDARSGKELHRATGRSSETFRRAEWDLADYVGREVSFRIVDQATGDWGHINVDHIISHPDSGMLAPVPVTWTGLERHGDALAVRGRADAIDITRTITLSDAGAVISHRAVPDPQYEWNRYEDRYTFAAGAPDFVWSQSIKRQESDLIPHWQFKSPAVIFQAGPVLASIVADLRPLGADMLRRQPAALDLGNPPSGTPWFSYGIAPSKLTSHSIYSRDDEARLEWDGAELAIDHILVLSGSEPPRQGYRRVVSHLWETFGRPVLLASPDAQTNYASKQLNLFDTWRQETWHRYVQEVYREFDCDGERCAALVSKRNKWSNKLGTNEDCWFNSWFQTLRTAYGMYVYGRRAGDSRIMEQARGVLNLALHAPQQDGAFPTIYWRGEDGSHNWVRDNGWAGLRDCYHVFDMAWTAYWMLRWHRDLTPDEDRIIPFCRAFGDFLVSRQDSRGGIPCWFDEKLLPRVELAEFNAETAGAALFLAELSAATDERQYLDAAQQAMTFIERFMLPRHRWFDYETFLSCSRKPLDFYDSHTQQWPQNNLSTFQAARACLRLHELTGKRQWRELGEQICDYAALTQQVFNHPLLTPKLIGGFTTQNTDAEWSDARQCYAAVILLDYYELTGRLAYLERGVAALRSTFAVAPYENWAHSGSVDRPGAMTGLHWGTGSAMASVEMKHDRCRDAYVHVGRRHGVGVNGCTLTDLTVTQRRVSFRLHTPYRWPTPPVAVIDGALGPLEVIVNGQSAGLLSPGKLHKGVALPFVGQSTGMLP